MGISGLGGRSGFQCVRVSLSLPVFLDSVAELFEIPPLAHDLSFVMESQRWSCLT